MDVLVVGDGLHMCMCMHTEMSTSCAPTMGGKRAVCKTNVVHVDSVASLCNVPVGLCTGT